MTMVPTALSQFEKLFTHSQVRQGSMFTVVLDYDA